MKSSRKPNVVVFFTDQQRWDSMAAHGNPLGITPNLDRAAKNGTHLFNAFTCQPVCGPARACLQTGTYATQTGVVANGIRLDTKEHPTLAHHFKAGGYQTGYIGKWHLGRKENRLHVVEEDRGGYGYWLAANGLEWSSDAYDCVLYDEDNERVKLPGYRVDAMTDAAIRYIDESKDAPFFLTVSYLEPHHQNHVDDYPAPDGYRERYAGGWTPPDLAALPAHPGARRDLGLESGDGLPVGGSAQQHLGGYWGMIKRLDEAYGRIRDALKSLELDKDTIVLFVTDHGCHFRTRNAEYKRSCHESSIRIPVVLTGGVFDGGGTVQELVSLVDLPPTLLASAGLPVPESMVGRSVTELLGGGRSALGAESWPDDVFAQISEHVHGRAVRTRRWKYGVEDPDAHPCDAHSNRYIETHLYDLKHDPYELRNLVGLATHRPVADRMKARLLKRIKEIEGHQPEIVNAPERPAAGRIVTLQEVDE